MGDKLLSFLFKHVERSPEAKFYESELTGISAAEFASLKKQKCLLFDQYDFESEHYFDKHGNERFVRKYNGKWAAVSTEDSGISPLYLKEQDLNRYTFSIQPLLDQIRSKNSLAKSVNSITSRIWYVGEKTIIQNNVGVFVALLADDQVAEAELLGLKAKIDKMDGILILCPSYQIKAQNLLSKLAGQNIVCLSFEEAFKKDGTIDLGKVRLSQVVDQPSQKLNDQQKADYTKYGYQCYDTLHIPGTYPRKRSNLLIVNGHKTKIGDKPFMLFMELVVELKKGKGGWLTKVVEEGRYQIFDRVRNPIKGSLLKKDGENFIEAPGSKQFRISTHPDFVTFDRDKLLEHPDATIRDLAAKLPPVT